MDGREARTRADKVRHRVHKFPRAVRLHPDRQARLVGLALLGGFHRHEGDGVGAILPAVCLAADRQVLELVIPGKIVRRVGRDGPHPLRIFQPERVDQLLCKIRGQYTGPHVLLIVGVHVLVKAAGV